MYLSMYMSDSSCKIVGTFTLNKMISTNRKVNNLYTMKTNSNADVQIYNLLLFFSLYYVKCTKCQSEKESRIQLRCIHSAKYESSVNHFFFILLLGD